ncbi:hypothetical protein Q9S36_46130 [Microbacterium sp. ARD31]|uniref:hypothetical protein n=1 Tax=Microbacterium sp. ARD31 TaxID=2962576 RepID=UPI002881D4BA|nr:hypothetical protein [Microbacterium sp. ARD31]MDT0187589.1 hypothetical protein [Microbacterium sp. ARD31]
MSDFHPCCPPPTGLVRPVRVDPAGLTGPTRGAAAGPSWRHSSHGLVVPADVPLTVEQRILEAAVRLPPGAMVTGWAALRLAGAAWFDGLAPGGRTPQPVPVLLPHASRIRGPGVLVERTRGALPPAIGRYGIPCAPGEVALLHEARRVGSPQRAGVMVDMALAARVVDLDALRVLASRRRQPDAVAYALERACGECRSPKESEMLQVWEGGLGFPRPLMNRQVLDLSGRVIAVVDLLDDESGTCGEYNGAAHRSRERQRRDEARADALRDVGLELFVLVAGDPERVWRERMHSARRRARWLPPDQRRWRVGAFVPAPPLVEDDEDQAVLDAMMLEHYRSLG